MTASPEDMTITQPSATMAREDADPSRSEPDTVHKLPAVAEFFRSPELVALMFAHCEVFSVKFFEWQRVNKFFRAVINSDANIQRQMRVRPMLEREIPDDHKQRQIFVERHLDFLLACLSQEFAHYYVSVFHILQEKGKDLRCVLELSPGFEDDEVETTPWTGPFRTRGPFYNPNVRQTWEDLRLVPFAIPTHIMVWGRHMFGLHVGKDATIGEVVWDIQKELRENDAL